MFRQFSIRLHTNSGKAMQEKLQHAIWSSFPCAIFLITIHYAQFFSRLPSINKFIEEIMLKRFYRETAELAVKYLSEGKRNIDECITIALHRSAKRATVIIPSHYRRICGNGILIERCLLSLNAMARVTASALQTRHGC